MRYVILKTEELEALEKLHKNSDNNTVRKRSQCLLLSHQRRTITDLSGIFDVSRRTIERWLDSWSEIGVDSLAIQPGRVVKTLANLNLQFSLKRLKICNFHYTPIKTDLQNRKCSKRQYN